MNAGPDPLQNDYLWDKSGPPDPEVERLEQLLTPLATPLPAPVNWPEQVGSRPRRWPFLAAAAALLLAGAMGLWWLGAATRDPGWEMAWSGGQSAASRDRLSVGAWLETGSGDRARLTLPGGLGLVEVAPGSRVRLVDSGSEQHRLNLTRGRLTAHVSAPPRLFVVDTPTATAVDLGCSYELWVAEDGRTVLEVRAGVVSLENGKHTSRVPRDARCESRSGQGPGVPYFTDSDPLFQDVLRKLERRARPETITLLLEKARGRDTLSLWHLLQRLEGPEQEQIYEGVLALVPEAATWADRELVLAGDAGSLEAWWGQFGPNWWEK